jgi:hypothetical protein
MTNLSRYKNGWMLLLFILIGVVVGGLIADVTAGVPALSWLSYGRTFGINNSGNPLILDLGILVITFALQIRLTIASILGVIIAIIVYKVI